VICDVVYIPANAYLEFVKELPFRVTVPRGWLLGNHVVVVNFRDKLTLSEYPPF